MLSDGFRAAISQFEIAVLTRGRVGGVERLEKYRLAMLLLDAVDEAGVRMWVNYVPTHINVADEPSRSEDYSDRRLCPELFLWLWSLFGPFELDWMSSHAARQFGPDGKAVPYFSRFPDLGCEGFPLHTQNVADRRRYCYPNSAMTKAVCKFALEQRANVVLVLELTPQPYPVWRGLIEHEVVKRVTLPITYCQRRSKTGWVSTGGTPVEAILLQF